MNRYMAGYITCSKMMHMYDYPPPKKLTVGFGGRWSEKGLVEGEVLGALFNREKLSLPLLTAIQ